MKSHPLQKLSELRKVVRSPEDAEIGARCGSSTAQACNGRADLKWKEGVLTLKLEMHETGEHKIADDGKMVIRHWG